jgi:DNA-binding protein HU-beta
LHARIALCAQQNAVEFVYSQEATKARIQAGFRSIHRQKPAKIGQFQKKTKKNRRKPVEMRCFPLTNLAESRKVNGGRVSLDPHQCLRSSHFVRRYNGNETVDRSQNKAAVVPPLLVSGGRQIMAAGMTKTALVRHLAEKLELTNKQVAGFLDLLAETAVKETKKVGIFVIPGLGRLVKAERKARIGRNPQTGEAIKIKAKTVVKFRVAKAAKDAIAPAKK